MFWEWISKVSSSSNQDETSRFWAQVLKMLNFYTGCYVSIRSGNWFLRNVCLKAVTPVFFAYCRDKYEHLCTSVIHSLVSLPSNIINHFLNGEWTKTKTNYFKAISFQNCRAIGLYGILGQSSWGFRKLKQGLYVKEHHRLVSKWMNRLSLKFQRHVQFFKMYFQLRLLLWIL